MTVQVCRADYANAAQAQALVELLDAYARDPMGGGEPLSDYARSHLVQSLAARPQAFSVLAYVGDERTTVAPQAVGLVNCFEGFSTFACQPLVNVHDLAVLSAYRGWGIAQRMLAQVEAIARSRGACKLTLEVLAGNTAAQHLYRRAGFAPYALDAAMGQAQFLQKWLD